MERGPSEIPMVSRVLLVRFTNIREGLTEMEIFHHICIKGRSGGGGGGVSRGFRIWLNMLIFGSQPSEHPKNVNSGPIRGLENNIFDWDQV